MSYRRVLEKDLSNKFYSRNNVTSSDVTDTTVVMSLWKEFLEKHFSVETKDQQSVCYVILARSLIMTISKLSQIFHDEKSRTTKKEISDSTRWAPYLCSFQGGIPIIFKFIRSSHLHEDDDEIFAIHELSIIMQTIRDEQEMLNTPRS